MIVTLITKKRLSAITLPEKVRGQYWLYETEANSPTRLIGIEAYKDEWILKSNRKAEIMDDKGNVLRNSVLHPLRTYLLKIKDKNEKTFIFTEPLTDDRKIYKKYLVDRDFVITIGRSDKNDIVISNQYISTEHARLVYQNEEWSVFDNDSTNGTFVNGMRIKNKRLTFGDVIYIMGVKIVIGNCFFAINNPDGKVGFVTDRLRPFISQEIEETDGDEEEDENSYVEYFYRSPRFKREIEKAVFKIDSPPQRTEGEDMPFMFVIGPSMTMGMASMSTAIFAVNNAMASGNISSSAPSIVMSSSMLLGTVLWPILSKRYEKKRKRKKEDLRQKKYKEYLDRILVKLNEECVKQEEILRENHISISDCVDRIQNVKRNLWERGLGQNDFLDLRVGIGNGELLAEMSYSERKFTIDDDNLQEELYGLCEKPKEIRNIPISFSLYEDYISGLIGARGKTKEFVKGIVFQLAALYSYDEVKLAFIYDQEEEPDFEFVKWLPHVWDNESKFRFIATNQNEVKEFSAYIEKEIEARLELSDQEIEDTVPYYIIFNLSKPLALRAEALKQVYAMKKNIHISVLHIYDELKNLPKECTMVVELEEQNGKLFDKNDMSGKITSFVPDIFLTSNPKDLSIKLSNVKMDSLASSFKLPMMVTFLGMFGVGKVEHLNALTRWKDNDPAKSLQAAVGIDTLGEIFKLDLHEKFHGPHGLIAGMTGSGKSEFIISYILSMAVNYHPDEVAFILIDYKGGGMAKSFENLPHTAGIITNLDGASIKRSLVSIESELKRRQEIFANVSKEIGVSNLDIYKYQRLYREGKVQEPIQHLFIISDEFAELKQQQPEFMTQLVSAARIGRSLGVHLVLATQKPSGVVDDQIWSNSKFKICLKVQERADSMDMLKRPDAAELTDTGRFYLQVGYNELFEMGQSSWAGAPYYPSEKVMIEKDDRVVVIDRNGRPIKEAKLDKKKNHMPDPKKQLDVVTDYLRTIASEEGVKIRRLWCDPIPAVVLWDKVKEVDDGVQSKRFVLNPIMGIYDDPARQRQCVLRVPISEEGNVVVYGTAGSGKTTFLNTMLYSIVMEHTPDEVNIYLLDFASETLRAFSKAPHVGDVILSFESEKISNLFKMLKTEIDKRKKMFADYGGDYRSYINATGNKLPSIVVVVNNFAAFTEQYEEKEEAVSFLSREGTKYGLYFVLTALGTGSVRFRLLQNFKQFFVLQLNDEADYATVLGKTDGLYPSKCKGRGLVKRDELYEFQVAFLTDEPIPFSFIQNECARIHAEWRGNKAEKIPILPQMVDAEFLSEYMEPNKGWNIPVGVEKNSLRVHYYPFGKSYIHMVLSMGNESQLFAYDMASFLSEKYKFDVTVIDAAGSYAEKEMSELSYYSNVKECETVVSALFDLVAHRHNQYKNAMENGVSIKPFKQKYVVINSIMALKNILSDESDEKMGLILEKGDARYNVAILFVEPVKNVSGLSFEKWYKKHVSSADGIWVGNGITEQYQLKPTKSTSEMHEDMPLGFGYVLQKGKAVKVKLLCSEKEDDDE